MTAIARNAAAAYGFLQRDARLFFSYRGRLVARLLASFVTLTLFYYLSRLVRSPEFPEPADYYAFVIVGVLILEVLQATLTVGMTLRQELVQGTWERLVLSPFGPVGATLGLTVFPVALACFVAFVTLLVGALLYGLPVSWGTAPLAVPIVLVGSAVFAAVGLVFAAMVVLVKQAGGQLGLATTLIALASGAYFPVTLLPGWLEWIAEVQPFKPTIDLLRHVLVDTPMPGSTAVAIVKVAGFAVVVLPLSALTLRAALRAAQRRGTIIEY
jgi:ABC-2 type transport system permease protein